MMSEEQDKQDELSQGTDHPDTKTLMTHLTPNQEVHQPQTHLSVDPVQVDVRAASPSNQRKDPNVRRVASFREGSKKETSNDDGHPFHPSSVGTGQRRKLYSDGQVKLPEHSSVIRSFSSQSRKPASKQVSNESSLSVMSAMSGSRSPCRMSPSMTYHPPTNEPQRISLVGTCTRPSLSRPYFMPQETPSTASDVKSLLTYTKCFMIAAYFVFLVGSGITVHPLIQFLMKDAFEPDQIKWMAGVILLILGGVSLVGLYGSLKEDSCVLLIYGFFILLVFILHVILLFLLKSLCNQTQKKCYRNMATPPGLAPILVAISELAISMCAFFMVIIIESERKAQRESRISPMTSVRPPTVRVKPRGSLQI